VESRSGDAHVITALPTRTMPWPSMTKGRSAVLVTALLRMARISKTMEARFSTQRIRKSPSGLVGSRPALA
jgi:hypothetical protein